jgi:DHA2 family multidrug resistance protein
MTAATTSMPPAMATAAPWKPKHNKWLVTVSITFGTLMGAIDASIVNVALPHMRGTLGVTLQEITWVSTGYVVAQVLVMPLVAFLGRRYGQKNVYQFCLLLFVLGSLLCGFASTLESLVVFRVLQGLGAGALQPTEQAILRQTFPPSEQGTAMALFGMAVMIGPAVGPTLGGFIVDHYPWPWIFYINVPIGILGFLMVSAFVEEPEDILKANAVIAERERGHVDYAGIVLLSVGLGALQFVLEEGQDDDWFASTTITVAAFVAFFALAFFVYRELTATAPVVAIGLFRDPVFASGTVIGSLMFAMLMANMFLLPVFMQELLGFTATQSGLALMPRTLVMMVATPIVGRLYRVVSPRVLIAMGVLFFTAGAYEMSHFTLDTSTSGVIFAISIQGIGFSLLFVPLTTVALSTVPRHRISDATGMNSLLRQIGGSLGLAIFATLLSRATTTARASLAAHLDPSRPEVMARLAGAEQAFRARGYGPDAAHAAALQSLAGTVSRQAAVLAFDQMFLFAGILFLGVLPLLLFLRAPAPDAAIEPAHVEIE